MYGEGISREGNVIDLGVNFEIVDKSGTWYSYEGTRLGQGKENAKVFLKENAALCQEIEDKIRIKVMPPNETIEKDNKKNQEKAKTVEANTKVNANDPKK